MSVNRVRLRHRVKLRDPAALKLQRLLKDPERVLVTVLIVTNLMNIFAIMLATEELVAWLGARGYFASAAIFLPVYLLGLELLPKSLFRRFPYRALARLAEPLRLADLLLTPLHIAGQGISRMFSRRSPQQRKLFVAREDFKYLTIESERTGTLTKAEREMIHNVIDFRAFTASDVMVPMEQVRTVPAHASIRELLAWSRESHLDRWPVVSRTGELVGLVDVFEVALDGRARGRVESFQRRIIKVVPNEPAYSIVRKMRAARSTMAAVIAADVKPLGIVTWEDLIKRLVGNATARAA